MGAFRHKRTLSPSNLPWYALHHNPSVAAVAVTGCRTLVTLLVLGVLGLSLLRFLPLPAEKTADVTSESSLVSDASVLIDGVGNKIDLGAKDRFSSKKLYLAAVIFNRVFRKDLFNITAYECKQWIEYMLFAGVDHVYWYDTAQSDAEAQEVYLQEYVKKGLLTYHRFHHLFPGKVDAGYHFEQDNSYEHFLTNHGTGVEWVVEMDVDEYPFMVSDVKRSFLRRYVQYLETARPDVSQILMPCMIFGGNPEGDEENGWVIERYQRRKRATEGMRPGFASRTKPIFRAKLAAGVSPSDPHQFPMRSGDTLVTDSEKLRMNHYWGPRLSDFKPDTAAVRALLVSDASAQVIADELKASTGLSNKATALRQPALSG